MTGWVKVHRSLLEWEWYDDLNTCRLFIHCLLKANHKAKSWRGIDIERGQFYTSLESLVSETGLTTRQIRTSLDKLESTGEVTSLGQARGRIITVSKYDQWQGDDKLSDKQMTSESSGLRQGSDRVATTTKNDKKEKNDKNTNNSSSSVLEVFQFWCDVMGKSPGQTKLTAKREKAIKARLKEGYSLDDIKTAINGCRNDPFSMGANDRQKAFNDIELICRTGEKLESFMQPMTVGRPTAQQQRAAAAASTFDPEVNMQQLEGL